MQLQVQHPNQNILLGRPGSLLRLQVMSLRGQFTAAVQQAQAAQAANPEDAHTAGEDDEAAKGIARLFAEVGESYTDVIASGARKRAWQRQVRLRASVDPPMPRCCSAAILLLYLRILVGAREETPSQMSCIRSQMRWTVNLCNLSQASMHAKESRLLPFVAPDHSQRMVWALTVAPVTSNQDGMLDIKLCASPEH